MGQKICAIVTEKKYKYDKNLIHFLENDVVIIPLKIDGNTIQYFIKEADNFDTIIEYIEYLKSLPFYNIMGGSSESEQSINSIIDIIETYKLEDFSIEYYTEWADIPDDNFYIAVINGKIKKDSIALEEEKFFGNYNNKKKYNEIIGLDFSWVANEERYFDYENAKESYYKK
ncbi:hypothetical protein ACFSJW_17510 [Flavobacterium artemisiae]|uniref:Uncharacterized protein n=1 Tax=Flavobacterium artemisiae TaxID=2126556 RepID=A0ABW4H9N6_9FLAO